MTESSHGDREKILDLQSKYKSEQSQRVMTEENSSKIKREMATTLEAMHRAEGEQRELQKKVVAMEHDMGALSNQDSLSRAELKASQMRETELRKELQYMKEVCNIHYSFPRLILIRMISKNFMLGNYSRPSHYGPRSSEVSVYYPDTIIQVALVKRRVLFKCLVRRCVQFSRQKLNEGG